MQLGESPGGAPENISLRHANYSADWWTPPEWLEWVDRTLGDSWFDPCPSDWNKSHPSGLDVDWGERVYCNHPGSRGSAAAWWAKAMDEQRRNGGYLVWCAFNVEQLRHMDPSPFYMPGWLVMPRERTGFIWGGSDRAEKRNADGKVTQSARVHGEPMRSPGNWAVWWCNKHPATPPVDCVIVRTS